MISISLLWPSRERPIKWENNFRRWVRNQSGGRKIEVILSIDADDPTRDMYPDAGEFPNISLRVICERNRSAIDAINNAAAFSSANILMVVSDDTACPDLWDYHLMNDIGWREKDFIIKTADGIQPWIITMPIMDRAYYNRFGYIYHPDYQHMFCDTELTCVADLTGRKLTSDILFKHNHYSITKEQPDAVNKKADATWAQGEKLFLERYKRNFDLKPEDIKGKIQDNGMINWLQKKAR